MSNNKRSVVDPHWKERAEKLRQNNFLTKSNLEKMPKVTPSKEEMQKMGEQIKKQFEQQRKKKNPSVGTVLKQAFKQAFSKKPKKQKKK